MKKKFKGQQLTEFVCVSAIVFGLCLVGVGSLGGGFAKIFSNNNTNTLFTNSNRVGNQVDASVYLSDTTFKTGSGLGINSPVENVVANNLNDGTYQTSGSNSDLMETLDIANEYADQLKEAFKNNIAGGSNPATNDVSSALKSIEQMQTDIANYVVTDGQPAANDLVKKANDLDITVDYGTSATALNASIDELLTNLDILARAKTDPTSLTADEKTWYNNLTAAEKAEYAQCEKYKDLLVSYSNSLLNIGHSLDYKIDSRSDGLSSFGIDKVSLETSIQPTVTTAKTVLTTLIPVSGVQGGLSSTDKGIDKKLEEIGKYIGSIISIDEIEKYVPKINKDIDEIQKKLEQIRMLPADIQLLTRLRDAVANIGNLSVDKILAEKVSEKAATLTRAEADEMAKTIDVYRNGNYTEIMPDSYNNKVLCSTLGGTITDNKCNTPNL
ncbi:MAG: hypothetical protein V2B14_00875 [bacterium]